LKLEIHISHLTSHIPHLTSHIPHPTSHIPPRYRVPVVEVLFSGAPPSGFRVVVVVVVGVVVVAVVVVGVGPTGCVVVPSAPLLGSGAAPGIPFAVGDCCLLSTGCVIAGGLF
jgi:hypothetical protein